MYLPLSSQFVDRWYPLLHTFCRFLPGSLLFCPSGCQFFCEDPRSLAHHKCSQKGAVNFSLPLPPAHTLLPWPHCCLPIVKPSLCCIHSFCQWSIKKFSSRMTPALRAWKKELMTKLTEITLSTVASLTSVLNMTGQQCCKGLIFTPDVFFFNLTSHLLQATKC